MAQATAAINLEVKGGSKLERIIQSVSRLESIVNNINAVPLKLDIAKADNAFSSATKGLSDVRQGIKQAQKDYNSYGKIVKNLEKDFVSAAQAVSKLTVGSREHVDALINQLQVEGRLTEARKKRGQLEERLQRQESKLPGAQRYLEEAERVRKLTVALTDLSDEYLRLGRSQAKTPVTGKVAASQTRGSIAQLQGQADALALVANNSEIASRQFNRFVVASQVASQKVFEGRQQQLKALAEGLALPSGTEARRQVGLRIGSQQDIAGARSLIGDVIASYGGIVKSEAALGSYVERLRSLQSIVPFDSQEWSLLETAINDVNGELRQLEQRFAGLRGQSSNLAKPIASLLPQFSVQSADKQARYKQGVQKKQEDQLEKLVDLEYEISKIKLDQNETLDLRNRLEKIFDDTTAGSIEAAKKQTVELKRQIRVIKDRNKEAGSDKAAGERPFATPLGGGAELKERFKTSRLIAEAQKEIADATELAANAGQRLIGLENSQQLRSALDDYTNGLKAIEEGADKILSKNKKLEQQFDRNLKQALASKRESLRVSEQFDSAVERVSGAETRIEIAAEKGLIKEIDKKKLLLGLDEARLAIDEKRFTLARTITSEVDRERKSREAKVRGEVIKTGQVSPIEGRRKVEGAIRSAQILERQLLAADKQGLNVSQELAGVKDAIASASSDDYQNTRKTLGVLLEANSAASDRLRLEKLIADEQKKSVVKGGTIRGGETLGLNTPSRLRNIQASGAILEQSLINLRAKGVDTSQELVKLQGALNKTKEDGYQITQRELDSLDELLNLSRKYVQLQKEILSGKSGAGGGKKDKTPGAGLEEALKSLRQARQAREQFLGGTSPAEAIDKIVREFNTGKPSKGAGSNVVNTLVSEARAGIPRAAGAGQELGEAVEDGLNKGLEIRSPSGVALRAMRNVINTAINAAKAGKAAVNAAIEDLFAPDFGSVQGVKLPKVSTASQDVIEKLANFIGRTSARPSVFRPLAGIAGSELLSGGSVNLAMQRKAFEAGKILPETRLLSLDERRLLRGSASAPGGGLEKAIRDAAVRAVSGTGAFTGPLSSAIRSQGVIASRVFSPSSQQRAGFGGTGIFPVTPQAAIGRAGSAFPFQTYRMGGAQQFPSDAPAQLIQSLGGRGDASRAVLESIKKYRFAVNNFWEGEDSQFEAVSRVVKSSVQLAGTKLARKLTESGRGSGLSNAVDIITGEKRTGVSTYLKNTLQRISDTVLNSAEALGYSVSNAFEDGIDRIRTGIPAAVSRGLSGISGAISGGGGGRGGAGGGGAGGSGDFGRRLEQAVAQGPEALLGLRELAKPATASIRELEALSSVLKEFRAVLDPTVEGFDRLEKQLRETAANLDRQLERRSPDADFLTRRFGPRGGRAVSEGLIGGAFPLLFGQGIGAAALGGLGGAAGGFAGGGLGFGLSLVGTALGTAFDEAVQGAKELGDALQKPVENFDQLAEKSFFSSKALEDTIKKTIEYGDTATASALIQEEAIKRLGVGGVQNLKTLGTESDRLNRAFAELGQQMQAVAAGPLASVTGFFANIFGQAAAAGRVRLLRANLSQEQAGQFNQEVRQRLREQGIQRGFFAPSAPTDAEIGMLQDRGALQDIVDKWQAIEIQGKIKLDPKQRIESEINALQKKLEVLDIGKSLKDQFRSAAREQEDLDKQRADLVRSYEESIGDIRKRVEDEVANRRFSILEKENQLLDQQGQNRLRQLQLINQEIIASAGRGERPEVEEAARRAAEIVAAFTESQLSTEEEAAKIKRDAALDSLKFDYQAAEFKASIEKEVSRLNIETARRVADINEQVRRRNEEFDLNRFKLEKAIAELQLKNNEIITEQQLDTARKNLETAKKAGDAQGAAYAQSFVSVYQSQLDIIKKGQQDISAISAPARLRGVGQVGGGNVPTANVDAIVAEQKSRIDALVQESLRGVDLTKEENVQKFKNEINDLAKSFGAPIKSIVQNYNDELQASARYIELLNQGLKGATAQQVIQLEQARAIAVAQFDQAIASLQNQKNIKGTTELQRGIIDSRIVELQNARDALTNGVSSAIKDVALNESIVSATEAFRSMREELNELVDKVNFAKFASETFGSGIAGGLTDSISAITGLDVMSEKMGLQSQIDQLERLRDKTKDNSDEFKEYSKQIANAKGEMAKLGDTGTRVQQALAKMLQGIGEAFVEMAQKIIAQQVTMIIFGTILKALGVIAGGADSAKNVSPKIELGPTGPTIGGFPATANGAYFSDGVAAFANGGMFTNSIVSSPTLFQFADGGVTQTGVMGEAGPEAIMPLERGPDGKLGVSAKLSGAMSRYSRPPGAAGGPEGGSGDPASGGEGATIATPIDVRYTVERVNNVDYVTADQFQRGMAQAAQQGALQGERRALRTLQNSAATRKRIGV